jgi:hypothetical protein
MRVKVERLDGMTSYKLSRIVAELKGVRGLKKAVLRAMADRYPNVWASIQTIAEDAGCGTTQARQKVRELEAGGIVAPVPYNGKIRKGGRHLTTQYTINVEKLLTMREEEEREETQRFPSPFQKQNPTVSEQNPTVSEQNPTEYDGKATAAVGEHRSKGEVEQRREERRDELLSPFNTAAGAASGHGKSGWVPTSKAEAERLTEAAINEVERVAANSIINAKDKRALTEAIASGGDFDPHVENGKTYIIAAPFTKDEVTRAAASIVLPLSDWDSKKAGELLAVKLPGRIRSYRVDVVHQQSVEQILEHARADMQAKAEQALVEVEEQLADDPMPLTTEAW